MSEGLFREQALTKLRSPEQLDEMMRVTGPAAWLALLALCAVLVTAVCWSVWGRIPTRVSGTGILIRPEGVFTVASNGAGPITRLLVKEGDTIKVGQVVAEVEQVELKAELEKAKSELESFQDEHRKVLDYCERQRKLKMDQFEKQRKELAANIREQEGLVVDAERMYLSFNDLRQQKLMSEVEVANARSTLVQARSQLRALDDQQLSILPSQSELEYDLEQKRFESEKAVNNAKRSIQVLEKRLKTASQVTSPYSGRVLEITRDVGDVVSVGTSILSVELPHRTMLAVIFVSDTEGKKVQKGMMIEVTPSTVKREEYGYIIGKVEYVSDFPATHEGMMRLLHNQSLVDQLSNQGTSVQMFASLTLDPGSVSGFKWSSRKSPPLEMSSGTLCSGSVVVRERPPITLVVPLLKRFFGLT